MVHQCYHQSINTFQAKQNECYQAVKTALQMGYRHIDTAEFYLLILSTKLNHMLIIVKECFQTLDTALPGSSASLTQHIYIIVIFICLLVEDLTKVATFSVSITITTTVLLHVYLRVGEIQYSQEQ